ncbi:hypothetical protein V865_006224 [Kwoniella europaea PYCC6329]|uniref:Uncharacterized protein n=1 Tax=Kwoniella europaea PYCC6329 TaxID=1423913 RepID=A0AAX4KPH4_9TREE
MSSNHGQLPSEGSSSYDLHAKGFQGIPNTQVSRQSGYTSYSLEEQIAWTAGQQSSVAPTQGLSRASTLSATAEEFKPGSTATSNN